MADYREGRILSRLPCYSGASSVDRVDAGDLTETTFRARYVAKNCPCVIVGAARHWPAFAAWRDPSYLLECIGSETIIPTRVEPRREIAASADPNEATRGEIRISFGEFIDRALATECGHLAMHSFPLSENSPLNRLRPDVGGFPFLLRPHGSRFFPPYRAFVFRNSYTDWHFHPADETIMCQLVGAKEVLLMPPDTESWEAMWPIGRDHGGFFDADYSETFAKLRPYRAVVEPGDGLFIPVFWWHAVEALEAQLGVTVAACFRSNLALNMDLRFPAARLSARRGLRTRFAPLVMLGILWSFLRRLRPVPWDGSFPG